MLILAEFFNDLRRNIICCVQQKSRRRDAWHFHNHTIYTLYIFFVNANNLR